jgi:Tol biopolymer transport system component
MELSIETGTVRPLRATRISELSPDYSPSGQQYAYADFSTGRSEIMVRDLVGSRADQLTFGSPVTTTSILDSRNLPHFSPDGRRIAFSQSGQIWTIPASGGQPVAITPGGEYANAAAWSPDNRWIAYQRGPLGAKRELVKLDSAGQGRPVTLSANGISSLIMFTRWSARGAIAYSGQQGIRLCAADGTGDRLLVEKGVVGDFSRAGDFFYAFKQEGEQWKLLVVEVASGRVVRSAAIEETPDARIFSASLHPDGKRLAYSRNELKYDIWMLEGMPRPATGWLRLFRHWTER